MGRIDAESETLIAIGVDEEQNAANELMGCLKSRQHGGGHEAFIAYTTPTLTSNGDAYSGFKDEHGLVPVSFAQNQRGELRISDVSTCLNKGGGKPGEGYPAVVDRLAVRRLTPLECERLQGFPDHYTAIPKAADGPRYKALGNSMAVPVMQWIGRRIMEVA